MKSVADLVADIHKSDATPLAKLRELEKVSPMIASMYRVQPHIAIQINRELDAEEAAAAKPNLIKVDPDKYPATAKLAQFVEDGEHMLADYFKQTNTFALRSEARAYERENPTPPEAA